MIAAACIAACLWQLEVASKDYFRYPTLSRVTIQADEVQEVPSATVCQPSVPLVKSQNFTTFSSAMHHDLLNYPKFIESDVSIKTRRFWRGVKTCVTVNFGIKTVNTSDPTSRRMFEITLRNATFPMVVFFLHERDMKICGSFDSFFDVMMIPWETIKATFSKYRTEFLPAPYDTNCMIYANVSAFDSVNDCIESCAISQSLSRFNLFPRFFSTAYDMTLEVPFEQRYNVTRNAFLLSYCRQTCPKPDCITNKYSVYQMRQAKTNAPTAKDLEKMTSVSTTIEVLSSTMPLHVTESVAMYDVITFATNFLGCIAFWTGLCPFSIFLYRKVLSSMRKGFTYQKAIWRLKSWIRNGYVIMIILLCCLAYAYQVYQISAAYFSYSTINKIEYMTRTSYDVPAIDFCHSFQSHAQLASMSMNNTFSVIKTHRSHFESRPSAEAIRCLQPLMSLHRLFRTVVQRPRTEKQVVIQASRW